LSLILNGALERACRSLWQTGVRRHILLACVFVPALGWDGRAIESPSRHVRQAPAMTDDWKPGNEGPLFEFIEPGMAMAFEYDSIGSIRAALAQTIEFFPAVLIRGWSEHKELTPSLRLRHFTSDRREIGRCLLDYDEVKAWAEWLRTLQIGAGCSDREPPRLRHFEYQSRHGIRIVWNGLYQLHVAAVQSAILPRDFMEDLLMILEAFQTFCREHDWLKDCP
jgi:hypothetical protein